MGNISMKNAEGYTDMTMHDALESIIREEKDSAARAGRIISRVKKTLEEEHFTLLNRIVIRDDDTGRVYK